MASLLGRWKEKAAKNNEVATPFLIMLLRNATKNAKIFRINQIPIFLAENDLRILQAVSLGRKDEKWEGRNEQAAQRLLNSHMGVAMKSGLCGPAIPEAPGSFGFCRQDLPGRM